jgi:hypothetical protein
MSVLNAAQRQAIPSSQFGLPGKRAYPMPDRAHAANAKARAAQFASPAERATIDAKANRILGKGAGMAKGGLVPGGGSGDSVPARLTPGEFVVRKPAANPILGLLKKLNKGAKPSAASKPMRKAPAIAPMDGSPAAMQARGARAAAFESANGDQAF